MKKLAIALALVALAGCAQRKEASNQTYAARGASAPTDIGRPDWLRDPARGEFPYSPKGW